MPLDASTRRRLHSEPDGQVRAARTPTDQLLSLHNKNCVAHGCPLQHGIRFDSCESTFFIWSAALAPFWLSIAKVRGDQVRIESLES